MGARFEPTTKQREMVESFTGFGLSQEALAQYLDVDLKTLRKHFRRELDTGKITANMKVAKGLFEQATKYGSVAAMCFWMKTQANWKETQTIELEGTLKGSITTDAIDPKAWAAKYANEFIESDSE